MLRSSIRFDPISDGHKTEKVNGQDLAKKRWHGDLGSPMGRGASVTISGSTSRKTRCAGRENGARGAHD